MTECLAECGAEFLHLPQRLALRLEEARPSHERRRGPVTETGLPLAYLNLMGGQDELVFDGASFVLNGDRSLALQMPRGRRPSR